jgi:enoyl-CoA hydratase/carnithine racemase
MELALTGRISTADEAAAMGVVNRIVPAGDGSGGALAAAMEMAAMICEGAPLAVRATKEMMTTGLDQPALEAAYAARYPTFEAMLESDDAAEGRAAFLQKRKPRWQGR